MRALLLGLALLAAFCSGPTFASPKTPLVNYSGQIQPIKSTDTVQTPAATTANASINLPHGTAPTSPVNGDCWTTTAGLFCQINGATVGPFGTGSGSVTTTGSPASGNLTKFSGATSITNGDLSGDVTTSGTLATTISANAVTTSKINNSAVTLAKIANAASNSVLLGSGASGSGSPYVEIALGTNLSMSGTTLNATGGGGSATLVAPQGRLTLVTGTPVMTSDQTAKSQVFYDCYVGNVVPYFTGSADASDTIASCEVSLTMQTSGTGVTNNAGVFDIWWVHSGANRVCVATNGSGGGWASDTGGSNTARGTGYSQVHNTRGYWTNVNSITHCYNGSTDYGSVSADQATYLGTLFTTAAGQTGMNYHPALTSGGADPVLGLYNAYNRVVTIGDNWDNASSFTYASTTWTVFNSGGTGSGLNERINYVDGLAQSSVQGGFEVDSSGGNGYIGLNLNATTGQPTTTTQIANFATSQALADFLPSFGLNFVQVMMMSASGTSTFFPAETSPTRQHAHQTLIVGGM